MFAPLDCNAQTRTAQLLGNTSVSSAVITNTPIFNARVTQTGDTNYQLATRSHAQ
jgi:hypothetical protein